MALTPGVRLGPYEIVSPLGAGGMGEVYRAVDTRLDRTVAIKVLPEQFAADPQLLERFDREARAISSLNHPHICSLFDVGRDQDLSFLVMEYLDGETLADRLHRSPDRRLRVDEALRIAIDIADALHTAHRAGIVHRDLKPANIFLARRGAASDPAIAKLLDFGLAKAAAPVIATSGLSMLPTTPPNLTAQGTILGTFQYMAPEQIEGLEADARTDIFAFGAIVFEMLTGRPAFEGKTRAQLLGAILKDEPPLVSSLQPLTPKALDRVVAICLAKEPDDRWQTARDLLRELKWASEQSTASAHSGPAEAGRHVRESTSRPSRIAWSFAAVLGLALIATTVVTVRHMREAAADVDALQFAIPAPDNIQFGGPPGGGTGTATQVAISPDGRQVAFVGRSQTTYALWVRPLEALPARQLSGTEDAAFPFWSPDSRFIGFFAGGKLKKVQVSGGPPIVLCDAAGRGGTWNRDNVIVFSPNTNGPLQRVSAAGGAPVPASVLDAQYGESSHRWPHFLPDGRHFLYTGTSGACCPPAKPGRLKIGALDATETVTLLEADSSSAYGSGHLLFQRDGTLMAQRFDVSARQLNGDAFPVAERVASEGSRYTSFAVSGSGTLVYAGGSRIGSAQLTWFDRVGKAIGTLGDPATYTSLALSPNDTRVAVSITGGSPRNGDIWTVDVGRGVTSRLTFGAPNELYPIWSPDSARIAFTSTGTDAAGLRVKGAGGTLNDEPLIKVAAAIFVYAEDWSPDGRLVAYGQTTTLGNGADLWIVPLSGDRKPFPLVEAPGAQLGATFAPDGRWIAYTSDESGLAQVYVQPFPPTGGRFQVSKDGGTQPQWRRDGKELFFLRPDGTMMATAIDTRREFEAGVAQALFSIPGVSVSRRQYAVTRDGKRFLAIVPERDPSASPLTVVVNWPASVQK